MSFLKAYLAGYENMISTSNDLERLKYGVQRVENGVFYNFKGNDMFKGAVKGLESLNIEVLKVERVMDTTRFTSALVRDYTAGMKKVLDAITRLDDGSYEVAPERTVLDDLYEIVAKGDMKAYRDLRSALKDKWFALDPSDLLLDLADMVVDKDVAGAKELVENFEDDDKEEEPVKPEKKAKQAEPEDDAKLTDEEFEIIEDIKSAIDDGDEADFKELLKELKEVNEDLYKEWKDAFKTSLTEPEADEDDGIVAEILEDLDKAIEEGDEDEIKELLEELKDEAGADSDIYKEYAEKCQPKKANRRERRGR